MIKKISLKDEDVVSVELGGFKSIANKTKINFSALTILSGANSSGKTSVSQAILLLKQTKEAAYDPGALLLNGPNVKLTSATQLLSQLPGIQADHFSIKFNFSNKASAEFSYKSAAEQPGGFDIDYIKKTESNGNVVKISKNSKQKTIKDAMSFSLPEKVRKIYYQMTDGHKVKVERDRCFFSLIASKEYEGQDVIIMRQGFPFSGNMTFLHQLIHVPGLRGNPERTYATTATTSGNFPGRFETYVASLVRNWEQARSDNFARLTRDLFDLGLTSEIKTKKIDDTQVEIKVSRRKGAGKRDKDEHLVSIADVGFGVSQVLPILVALNVAQEGQYIIIEQPELHLHPKAQSKLAHVLAEAMVRGVRVIIETHSNILLQGIQTLVAREMIAAQDVALNWFESTDEGYTVVSSGEFNTLGAFGQWPADFMDIQMKSEADYLDAVEKKLYGAS